MISTLIFTKDRACQLDLLLTSIQDNFKELKDIHIICKGTESQYITGYLKVRQKFRNLNWYAEGDLCTDIKRVVNDFKNPFSVCFVDDEVVIRDHSIEHLLQSLQQHKDIHTASLRLGMNIGNYTYTANIKSNTPLAMTHIGNNVYKWDWTKGDQRTDWFYPSCINSNIFRTEFLKYWINNIHYRDVNNLEGTLNINRKNFKPHMICCMNSKTVNIANNLTQSGTNRHSNKHQFSLQVLNEKYLNNWVINKNTFYNMNNSMATFEHDYEFIK